MRPLNFELKSLLRKNRSGSFATQQARERSLFQMADQLFELGYKMKSAKGLKPKHVEALVFEWEEQGLTVGTIKNRLTALRWWADVVGKASIMKPSNNDYGVGARKTYTGNRAQKLDLEAVSSIDNAHIRLSLKLMAAFGLRREEGIKIQPTWADQGDHIRLKGSWCKGGRDRTVPITTERQRALLDKAKTFLGNTQRSLIPDGDSYIKHLKRFENQTLKAGITNVHGLRHNYAQWRYKHLTGMDCPARGGLGAGNPIDFDARLHIARELGHNRIAVTVAYLGPRS